MRPSYGHNKPRFGIRSGWMIFLYFVSVEYVFFFFFFFFYFLCIVSLATGILGRKEMFAHFPPCVSVFRMSDDEERACDQQERKTERTFESSDCFFTVLLSEKINSFLYISYTYPGPFWNKKTAVSCMHAVLGL